MLRKENERKQRRNPRRATATPTTIQPKWQFLQVTPHLRSIVAQVRAGTKRLTNHRTALLLQWHSLSVLCANHATNQKFVVVQPLIWLDFSTFWAAYNLPSDLWTLVIFYWLNYLYILLNIYKLTKMLCDMFHILCIVKIVKFRRLYKWWNAWKA